MHFPDLWKLNLCLRLVLQVANEANFPNSRIVPKTPLRRWQSFDNIATAMCYFFYLSYSAPQKYAIWINELHSPISSTFPRNFLNSSSLSEVSSILNYTTRTTTYRPRSNNRNRSRLSKYLRKCSRSRRSFSLRLVLVWWRSRKFISFYLFTKSLSQLEVPMTETEEGSAREGDFSRI